MPALSALAAGLPSNIAAQLPPELEDLVEFADLTEGTDRLASRARPRPAPHPQSSAVSPSSSISRDAFAGAFARWSLLK